MLKTFTKLTKDIGLLTVALTLALVANFAYGQWADPTGAPPANNVAAPVNLGTVNQTKNGGLGVTSLVVAGDSSFLGSASFTNTSGILLSSTGPRIKFADTDHTDWWIHTNTDSMYFINDRNDDGAWTGENPWPLMLSATDRYAKVDGQVRANEYCDANGENCFAAGTVGGGSTYGGAYTRTAASSNNNAGPGPYPYVEAGSTCTNPNPQTGDCSCPSGFTASVLSSTAGTSAYNPGDGDYRTVTAATRTYQCSGSDGAAASQSLSCVTRDTGVCLAGETLTGGGCQISCNLGNGGCSDISLTTSMPSGNSWVCGGQGTITSNNAYAVCCSL